MLLCDHGCDRKDAHRLASSYKRPVYLNPRWCVRDRDAMAPILPLQQNQSRTESLASRSSWSRIRLSRFARLYDAYAPWGLVRYDLLWLASNCSRGIWLPLARWSKSDLTIQSSRRGFATRLISGVRLGRACACRFAGICDSFSPSNVASASSALRSSIHAECRHPGVRANPRCSPKSQSTSACGSSHLVAPSSLTIQSSRRGFATRLISGVRSLGNS